MPSPVDRRAVDLSSFPDLVVIYLGMRVRTLTGIKTLLGLGSQIDRAGANRPEGLLHFENNIIFSLFPFHLGMRWYWKDFESMERWARSEPHRIWWQEFLRSSGGTGFWHETYFMRGGMEAIYDDVNTPLPGFMAFAPSVPARGRMFSARRRLDISGESPAQPTGVAEADLWTLDFGLWTLDFGLWTLDFGRLHMPCELTKLTPNLIVSSVERSLAFYWTCPGSCARQRCRTSRHWSLPPSNRDRSRSF
jgi:hypothetical protein